jgi:hypothetical protein
MRVGRIVALGDCHDRQKVLHLTGESHATAAVLHRLSRAHELLGLELGSFATLGEPS